MRRDRRKRVRSALAIFWWKMKSDSTLACTSIVEPASSSGWKLKRILVHNVRRKFIRSFPKTPSAAIKSLKLRIKAWSHHKKRKTKSSNVSSAGE